MNVFIIEDEPLGVERLQKQLREIDPLLRVVGTAESIQASVNWLRQNPSPDLLLMDIELADGQSFDIFRQVEVQSPVIFTTSYDEYTLRAFKVNSIDYLLKPIKKEELKKGIEKLKGIKQQYGQAAAINVEDLVAKLQGQQRVRRSRFLVKQGQRLVSVDVADVAYFFTDGRLSFLMTWNRNKYVLDYSLEDIVPMLDPADYLRINRGFIVHNKAVRQIHNHFNGKLKLELNPPTDKEVLISRESASEFKDWMGR